MSMFLDKLWKTKDGYVGKALEFKWFDNQFCLRLDNYLTYRFSDLEFAEYSLVDASDITHISIDTNLFKTKEDCLEFYSDFKIEKETFEYYYGHYRNKPCYIRTIPRFDKFIPMYYFSVGNFISTSFWKFVLEIKEGKVQDDILYNRYKERYYPILILPQQAVRGTIIQYDEFGDEIDIEDFNDNISYHVIKTKPFIKVKAENRWGYINYDTNNYS